MERQEFESLSTKEKRAYIKKVYPKIKSELIQEYHDSENYSDTNGLRTEIHHCWERSHCPLWYHIDKRNMILWSSDTHFQFHNTPRDKWNITEEANEAELIKNRMINDNLAYCRCN